MTTQSDRAMGFGLRALNRLASLDAIDRIGARKPLERLIYNAGRNGFKAVDAAGRTFARVQKLTGPKRLTPRKRTDLFDITPDDEQSMMIEAVSSFAAEKVRPAALDADAACAAPPELLTQANDLGLTMLGVPAELGGVAEERSSTTAVLLAEALAHGDMGFAVAALSPAAVSTAIGLWGDADQQATYLHEFVGEDVPAAALALAEPRALFDPFELSTTATQDGADYVLNGEKSLVARASDSELFVIGADLAGRGPALFIVESKAAGLEVEPEPGMGVRAAATGRLRLTDVRIPSSALLGGADPETYAECVQRARLGWCAVTIGTAQAVLDYVIPYVNERIAFGEPISNRQSVAFKVSDIGIELEGIRLTALRAAGRADRGKAIAHEVTVARALCAKYGMLIGSDGIQLLGGHGYIKEHPVERWYRDLRAAGLMEGVLLA